MDKIIFYLTPVGSSKGLEDVDLNAAGGYAEGIVLDSCVGKPSGSCVHEKGLDKRHR